MNATTALGPEERLVVMFLSVGRRIKHHCVKNTALMLKTDGNQPAARKPGQPEREATPSLGRGEDQGVLTERLQSKLHLRAAPGARANIPAGGDDSLI